MQAIHGPSTTYSSAESYRIELGYHKLKSDIKSSQFEKKYVRLEVDDEGKVIVVILPQKPYPNQSAFCTLSHLKDILYTKFPNAYERDKNSNTGSNIYALAKLIKQNYFNKSSDSCFCTNMNRKVQGIFEQIENRVKPPAALPVIEDIFKKIFSYLSIKEIHFYECINRAAYYQAQSVWNGFAESLNLKLHDLDSIRNKISTLGNSLNSLIKTDFISPDCVVRRDSGMINKEKTLLKIYNPFHDKSATSKKSSQLWLDKAFYHSLSWFNKQYWKDLLILGASPTWIHQGWSSLLQAIEVRNDEAVKEILLTVNPNHSDEKGITPLHWAAYKGGLENIKILVKRGVVLNAETHDGLNALHYACKGNHLSIVEYLLDHQVEIDHPDYKGQTPLFYALFSLSITKLLLKKGAQPNIALASDNLITPLHMSIQKGFLESTSELLKAGANVNLPASNRLTPLFLIFKLINNTPSNYLFKMALNILEVDTIDLTHTDNKGKTALHLAVQVAKIKSEAIYYYQPYTKRNKSGKLTKGRRKVFKCHLVGITNSKMVEIIEKLIILGARVDVCDNEGNTPLDMSYPSRSFNRIKSKYIFINRGDKTVAYLRQLLGAN